jgi:hypothetical protein
MRTTLLTLWPLVLFTLALHPCTALAQAANGALQPAEQRKAAPELALQDIRDHLELKPAYGREARKVAVRKVFQRT